MHKRSGHSDSVPTADSSVDTTIIYVRSPAIPIAWLRLYSAASNEVIALTALGTAGLLPGVQQKQIDEKPSRQISTEESMEIP